MKLLLFLDLFSNVIKNLKAGLNEDVCITRYDKATKAFAIPRVPQSGKRNKVGAERS